VPCCSRWPLLGLCGTLRAFGACLVGLPWLTGDQRCRRATDGLFVRLEMGVENVKVDWRSMSGSWHQSWRPYFLCSLRSYYNMCQLPVVVSRKYICPQVPVIPTHALLSHASIFGELWIWQVMQDHIFFPHTRTSISSPTCPRRGLRHRQADFASESMLCIGGTNIFPSTPH
jgi:hypothetical protein